MKFQLKALAVAAVLAAALPAQAAIDTTASGNGEFVLTVLDRSGSISALFDLGINYSEFNVSGTSFVNSGVTNQGTTFSWDLTSGDYAQAWSLLSASANFTNVVYGIAAGDNLGAPGVGSRGYISTYLPQNSTSLTTLALITSAGNIDTYTGANGANSGIVFQNHRDNPLGATAATPGGVENGGSVATTGAAYGNGLYGVTSKINGTGPTSLGAIGADLGVVQVVSGASSFATASQTVFGNGAKFNLSSNGILTYSTIAAVPEADTWAMMLLGLGFMGFVARRKQA
ncbi:MAG: PEP-CTERM sorting domain-containing protein [Pseudomonadota bacterium]